MRHALVVGLAVTAAIGLAGCSQPPQQSPSQPPPTSPEQSAGQPGKPPPEPRPARIADCPYLSTELVEQRNGQGVGEVRISTGKPPACFFYRPDGERQLRTWVFHGELDIARAVVDAAAPVRTSARASLPGGWEGGAQPLGTGSVYAVAKPNGANKGGTEKGTAVVVFSNQAQSVKARELAKVVIRTLRP